MKLFMIALFATLLSACVTSVKDWSRPGASAADIHPVLSQHFQYLFSAINDC